MAIFKPLDNNMESILVYMRNRLAWMAIFKLLDNNMERILVLHEEKIGLDGNFLKFWKTIWKLF
jgi:hypothetical protein